MFSSCAIAGLLGIAVVLSPLAAWGAPLTVEDFTFEGPLGSQGARIESVGENHFKVYLGPAPCHEDWNNKLQFTIMRDAKGNSLTLDVVFEGGPAYCMNEYACSWSYNAVDWTPILWEYGMEKSKQSDRLCFPEFSQDTVYVGHQVPMSYEDVLAYIDRLRGNPSVTVHLLGKSIGGRDIHRLEITSSDSTVPREKRWVHYFANQHPGEHNSQWRMTGMIDWLLSEEGADCRNRSICHFVLMMSPDAPSKGWYRVNAQGIDMNRTYRVEGADKDAQAHEAFIGQNDLEQLMASDASPITAWSMHTWGGKTDPRIIPGPEMSGPIGPWSKFAAILAENDTESLFKEMELWPAKKENSNQWAEGAHMQFGITSILCEGAGAIYTKTENVEAGAVLMNSIAEYYTGTR